MDEIPMLVLESLRSGLPGVSPVRGMAHAEACLVCLENQQHASGTRMKVEGNFDEVFELRWDTITTDQIRRSWNDLVEATESAACGIAFLLILQLTPYTVIDRSKRGTGYDYLLGFEDDENMDEIARLEISGILHAATDKRIEERVNSKLTQTDASDDSRLPAYIVVVEFGKPVSHVVQK